MTPEQWEKVSEIFQSASRVADDEREALLSELCGTDETLRREVESLLAAEAEIGDFIEHPIVGDLLAGDEMHEKALKPGDVIAHYRIVAAIGFGGMGEVYRAADSKLNRRVALKILPPHFVIDAAFLRRFRNEAHAAATLNHPNVATVYSIEDFGGRPFITMEYVDGETLRDLMRDGGLPLDTFVRWFESIADGFAHAHDNGVTHRDIKPGNIMITSSGAPKILDFGLAQIESQASVDLSTTLRDITAPGQVIGTPSYMSPEQAAGEPIDHRSDIFSLGIVMYEALTGSRPFAGDNYGEVVHEILTSTPRPVAERRQEIPPGIASMIDKCLAKSPSARISSMHQVRSMLRSLRSVGVESGSMDSFVRRFYREPTSGPNLWRLGAALAVVVLTIGSWYFVSRTSVSTSFRVDKISIRKLSQSNNVALSAISPDGRSVVYVTYEEDDGRSLWLRRVTDANAIRVVPSQQVHYWDIAFSNDSEHIYFITAPRFGVHGTLFRVPALGGQPRKITERVNHLGNQSPDGKRVLYVRYGNPAPDTSVNVTDSTLISANSENGNDEQVVRKLEGESIIRKARFSADGQSVFYIRRELKDVEYWSIVLLDTRTGNEREVIRKVERIDAIAPLQDGIGLLMNAVDGASNRRQLFHVAVPAGEVTRITNDLNNYSGVSVDRDGHNIVAVQRKDESRVWLGNSADLRAMTPLTREPLGHNVADWTPDGRIVFDVLENDRLSVWIADADGKNALRLTPQDSDNSNPRVSGNGRYIVFTSKRAGLNQVWRMDIDGGNQILLANVPGMTQSPQFAADGSTVVFRWYNEGTAPMGQVSVESGPVMALDYFPNAFQYFWAQSPDGRFVAYTLGGQSAEPMKVVVRPVDAAEPKAILNIRPAWFFKWMPNGKGIFYQESQKGEGLSTKVFQIDLDKNDPKLLMTTAPDDIVDLSFSRDSSRFAAVRLKVLTDAVMLTAAEPASAKSQ